MMFIKGVQGKYLPKDRLNYWLERHEHPIVKVPTQWHVTIPPTIGWMKQYDYFSKLYSRIADLPGDIAECGLGEGTTFAMLARRIGEEGKNRTLYGFDSFEGWPKPAKYDASPANPKEGTFKVDEELVRRCLEDSGMIEYYPNMTIQIKKGFLRDSLPEFIEENPDVEFAFVHADVDLYEGYRDIFKYLWEDHVVKGGIVALDEYREFPPLQEYGNGTIDKWPGCTKAVDDFFRDRPEKPQYYPETDKWYVVKETD